MSTPIDTLRRAIRERLETSPLIMPIPATTRVRPHSAKMDRYVMANGQGIAHEHNHRTVQHLWVRADAVAGTLVGGIEQRPYGASGAGGREGRHSNLAPVPGFAGATLIRFSPKTVEEAARILDALAAHGSPR